MVEWTDCKNFYYEHKEITDEDGLKKSIEVPECWIDKMTDTGCPEDCKFFKPKALETEGTSKIQ